MIAQAKNVNASLALRVPEAEGQHVWAESLIPLIAPEPPRLSEHVQELAALEASGVYSNYGPMNTALERDLLDAFFQEGACVTVCNATIGLMLAIREVIGEERQAHRKYALMPSFTFAATGHAAAWCGLTPLFCDIDRDSWLPNPQHEEALLREYEGQIAVIVPYATFGNNLDLSRYERLAERYGVPVVVDAAASLGSLDQHGRGFGSGFRWPVVFSMHATKAFSVGEGGLIYSGDQARIDRLRWMGSFGFSQERSATHLGLNSKMSEVTALTARLQLQDFERTTAHKGELAACYAQELDPLFTMQQQVGLRQSKSFQSVLLPLEVAPARLRIVEVLRASGVGAGTYFSPHLAEQPYFQRTARHGELPVTAEISMRVLSLPLTARMNPEQVREVVRALHYVVGRGSVSPDLLARSSKLGANVTEALSRTRAA